MLLVPATMELLGARNWWIPAWLDRLLPQLRVEAPETVDHGALSDAPHQTAEPVGRAITGLGPRSGKRTVWYAFPLWPDHPGPAGAACPNGERADRRHAILDAAMAELINHGYEKVTMLAGGQESRSVQGNPVLPGSAASLVSSRP